jgi:hypothetical protein
MKPRTLADAEAELRTALDVGDPERIGPLAREVDQRTKAAASVPLHSAALWYAEQGLRILPLTPGTKIPFKGSNGCKDATTDTTQINAWWTKTPDANIGIATGHLVDVVDVDGPAGQKSRATHWEMFEALTVIGKVLTPRPGGMHLYVPAKPGIGNGANLLDKVDYRGDGGYVVAPPSVNEQGTYRWLTPLDVATFTKVVA